MQITRRGLIGSAALAAAALPGRARAQSNTIKIGVMNDGSGPYRDIGGQRQVDASIRRHHCHAAEHRGPGRH